MPSRMSCSLTMTSAKPRSADDPVQDQGAGADDVDPAGVHTGIAARAEPLSGRSRLSVTWWTWSRGDAGVVDLLGVVGGQVQRDARDRGDRAGQADQGAGPRPRAPAAAASRDGRVDVGGGRLDLPGRGRVAVQVPLGQPDAADVHRAGGQAPPGAVAEHELGRAAADVHHQVRARQRRCRRRRSSAVAPAKDRAASSPPVSTSGGWPEDHRHGGEELGRVGGVAGGAGGDHADRGRAAAGG